MPNAQRENDCPRFYRTAWLVIIAQLVWFASIALSRQWLDQEVVPPGIYSWLLAFVPMILGALVVWAYIQIMRALDELWVMIYLRALAFTFGVSVVALLTYPILELANAPELDVFVFGAFSLFVFFGAAIYCARRYS